MFACSPVETETMFFGPKNTFNNKKGEPSSRNRTHPLPSSSFTSDPRKQFQQFHEATLKRIELKQELQRRHRLCAENERLCRERTEKRMALKKTEECNALRRFYEQKSVQFNCSSVSSSSSSSFNSSSSSSASSSSSRGLPSKSPKSACASIKRFQAAYKIHAFIKHHIEKRKTQKIISQLIKLRSMQNRLAVLKSINLKVRTLTFDNNENKVSPITINNKSFLIYKDSISKVLNQLDNEFTDEFYLIRERRFFIKSIAYNILQELDNEQNTQYNNFIKKNQVEEDFVFI